MKGLACVRRLLCHREAQGALIEELLARRLNLSRLTSDERECRT